MPGSINVLISGRRGNISSHVLLVWLLPHGKGFCSARDAWRMSGSPWHCANLISGESGKHWGLTSGCGGRDSLGCGKEFSCCKGRKETSPCCWHIHLGMWGTFAGCLNLRVFSMPSVLFSFFVFKPEFLLQEWFWDSLYSSDSSSCWYLAVTPYQILGAPGWRQHSNRVHFSCEATNGFMVGWRWKKRLTERKELLLCWVSRYEGNSAVS